MSIQTSGVFVRHDFLIHGNEQLVETPGQSITGIALLDIGAQVGGQKGQQVPHRSERYFDPVILAPMTALAPLPQKRRRVVISWQTELRPLEMNDSCIHIIPFGRLHNADCHFRIAFPCGWSATMLVRLH